MPFYRFSQDIPEEADIVRERLQAETGERSDNWIRGKLTPRFFGRFEDDIFRIRRNIGYSRNSFLPRIRGQVTATGSTTRLKVTMWMNPLVLAFMLAWFVGVANAVRISVASNPHLFPIPVLMFVFGLCLCLGGFYWEAQKARTLLSKIATNAAIDLPVPYSGFPDGGSNSRAKDRRYLRVVSTALLGLILVPTALTLYQQQRSVTSCPAFQDSMKIAVRSPEAKRLLGDHIAISGFPRGWVQDRDKFGYAMISISLRGSKDKGTLYAVANRVKGRWDLERTAVWRARDSQRIDLTPPTRRETFRYPTKNLAYLVPFDEQAAAQLSALPAYYSARLGLQVTVLPIMPLGRETLDSESHQILAERATDFLERSSRKLYGQIDGVFLGVTSRDLNIRSAGWSYATNYRTTRCAILSTARLHDLPVLAGANPEVFPVRVRKMVTKNLALMLYPLTLSEDPTSALATSVFASSEVDRMTEELLGENGKWQPIAVWAPCFSIILGPAGKQTWVEGCGGTPPNDNRFETLDNYTGSTSLVLSRTDFPVDDRPRLSFVRKYWGKDEASRTFGVGANSSFSIFPVGDSAKFSWIDLIREDGAHVSFRRTSFGTGYANAILRADRQIGNPFSESMLAWNGAGWDLKTTDGWTYQFPSSGPSQSAEQSALTSILSASNKIHIKIKRNAASGPERIEGLEGGSIDFKLDANNRIVEARHSSGHAIQYEYAPNGRLAHILDSETGGERYAYDQANRLTAVLDEKGNAKLSIAYGYLGEVVAETFADGRMLRFKYQFYPDRTLYSVTLTDDRGFTTQWTHEQNGFDQSLPMQSSALSSR